MGPYRRKLHFATKGVDVGRKKGQRRVLFSLAGYQKVAPCEGNKLGLPRRQTDRRRETRPPPSRRRTTVLKGAARTVASFPATRWSSPVSGHKNGGLCGGVCPAASCPASTATCGGSVPVTGRPRRRYGRPGRLWSVCPCTGWCRVSACRVGRRPTCGIVGGRKGPRRGRVCPTARHSGQVTTRPASTGRTSGGRRVGSPATRGRRRGPTRVRGMKHIHFRIDSGSTSRYRRCGCHQ